MSINKATNVPWLPGAISRADRGRMKDHRGFTLGFTGLSASGKSTLASALEVERLAAYLIRASFSQERMKYFPEQLKVIYHSKDYNDKKTYDALEWPAANV